MSQATNEVNVNVSTISDTFTLTVTQYASSDVEEDADASNKFLSDESDGEYPGQPSSQTTIITSSPAPVTAVPVIPAPIAPLSGILGPSTTAVTPAQMALVMGGPTHAPVISNLPPFVQMQSQNGVWVADTAYGVVPTLLLFANPASFAHTGA
ncbi:hypothetical protein C8J56DRAFT_1039022 [Mycena floridula]|nr:hypothetical protein C8J56DRAFT_1039022 [Mycena floridula]